MKERFIKIGLISISDRAASGEYIDKGLPNLKSWLNKVLVKPFSLEENIIPDEIEIIKNTLKELSDKKNCDLILTTGGTGPAKRDVTPEATLSIGDKEMPGFGEQMRQISLNFVPTAILSRQVAVIRNKTLIINLPGQPKAIEEILEGVKNKKGDLLIPGIFAAVPYCLDLIGAPYIETKDTILKSFRPKKK